MEQTLGKRIMQSRKALGLTQDQLAERLGVTAQAVSKWENDQSCPDINSLPKLAEIFGTSVDALLGREPIYQAEVVQEAPPHQEKEQKNWEFSYHSGRRGSFVFAVFILALGALLLLARICGWDVGFWSILWPTSMLVFGLNGVIRRRPSVFCLGLALFGGYSLIANLGIWTLSIAQELILPIMFLLFGLGLLLDALRHQKKGRFRVMHNGKPVMDGSKEVKGTYRVYGQRFECSQSFGENRQEVCLSPLGGGEISCSFAELTVDLTGCETLKEGCSIEANCSFGNLTLLVPRRFLVKADNSTSFANLEIHGQPAPNPAGTIFLDASVSFGNMDVRYI